MKRYIIITTALLALCAPSCANAECGYNRRPEKAVVAQHRI